MFLRLKTVSVPKLFKAAKIGRYVLNEEQLMQRRSASWQRLELLTRTAERGLKYLSGDEIVEMTRLYRQASADHAAIISSSINPELGDWLGRLVGRSYGVLYQAPTRPIGEWLKDSLRRGAATVRKRSRPIYLAALLFFGSSCLAALMLHFNPNVLPVMLGPEYQVLFESWKSGQHEARTGDESVAASFFYATNNPFVGVRIAAFSSVTLGILGVFMLWMNGAMLGLLAYEMSTVGQLKFLLVSIFPHGVSEIGGILLTTAAGFILGGAVISPGRRTRLESLKHNGKDSLTVLVVGLVMIFCAAPIEGFFSFNPAIPQWSKMAFGITAVAAWMGYFVFYGRDSEPEPSELDAETD